VLGVLVLVAVFWYLVHNYQPAMRWWNKLLGNTTETESTITLPRSDNATIKAYKTNSDGSVTEMLPNGSGKPVVYEANTDASVVFSKPDVQRPGAYSDENEVFNVSNNIFTYEDAPAVCQAFDAKLATPEQVKNAQKNGADWCNYGWTAGQHALYPTQKATIDRLKKIKGHENDCGREGVNGGYFENPYLEFGVNCYGKKPKPRAEEKALIGYFPDYVTESELRLQERVAEIKQVAGDLTITPFNRSEWDAHRNVFEKAEDWVRDEFDEVKRDLDPHTASATGAASETFGTEYSGTQAGELSYTIPEYKKGDTAL
jgi:hypothetical protein